MKALAIFLIVVCLVSLGGIGYLLVTSNLDFFSESCASIELGKNLANQELFDRLKDQLENGSFTGTKFSDELLTSADDYLIYTWTVRVENRTALPARAVEIQVLPMNGYDILQFDMDSLLSGYCSEHIIPPHSSARITVSVLTSRSILNAPSRADIRDATVSWYLGGFPFPETNGKGGKLVLTP